MDNSESEPEFLKNKFLPKQNTQADEENYSIEKCDDIKSSSPSTSEWEENANDDDSSGENEIGEFEKLLEDVKKDKYSYDKYLKLCECAHASSDLDKIRLGYKVFSEIYPLEPQIWLQYLKVLVSISQSISERADVIKIFKRALEDYYSVEVALKLVDFLSVEDGQEEHGELWIEILDSYGTNFLHGHEFFKLRREQISNNTNLSLEKKMELNVKTYIHELTLPLRDMDRSYIDFRVLYESKKEELKDTYPWPEIECKYRSAVKLAELMLPFETKLQDDLDYDCFLEYIKILESFEHTKIWYKINCHIYERMVTKYCLHPHSWQLFINFVNDYGGISMCATSDASMYKQTATEVTLRALRNCICSHKLYIIAMNLMERDNRPRRCIDKLLEDAVLAGFPTPQSMVDVWLYYLSYLRRQTDLSKENDIERLRINFQWAWDHLGKQWGELADCNCEILQFWGRLEYEQLGNPKRGRELWETVMESADNANNSALWVEYSQLESRVNFESATKIYQRALSYSDLDNQNTILNAWQLLERCHGNPMSQILCIQNCDTIIETQQLSLNPPLKQQKKPSIAMTRKALLKNQVHNEKNEHPPTAKKVKLSKNTPSNPQEQSPLKSPEVFDKAKDNTRVFLSNLDFNLTEQNIYEELSKKLLISRVDLLHNANGKSRGCAYIELKNDTEVEKALALDRHFLNGRPIFISNIERDPQNRRKFKYDTSNTNTLFIKGLPSDCTKEEVEEIFTKHGLVKDIRLVYHKSGKFKNLAYVEYVNEFDAGKALLSTINLQIREHDIIVAISAPPPRPHFDDSTNKPPLAASKRKIGELKPRISFVPNAVRRNFNATTSKSDVTNFLPSVANDGKPQFSKKTNEDFRKLLS